MKKQHFLRTTANASQREYSKSFTILECQLNEILKKIDVKYNYNGKRLGRRDIANFKFTDCHNCDSKIIASSLLPSAHWKYFLSSELF